MNTTDEIYKKLDGKISKEEFLERIEEKIERMNGLCDEQTAAMLVLKDIGVTESAEDSTISNIKAGDNVNISAKVVSLLGVREFNRNDGTLGMVGNIKVADETGAIRVTLWDDKAELIKSNKIKKDLVYQIQGYAKDGYSGIEINVGKTGTITEIKKDIFVVMKSLMIEDIKDGMRDVNTKGRVLNISDVRMFNKKGGTVGKVCSLEVGDVTGKIRITLWNDKTDLIEFLEINDSIEILNAYAKENNFSQKVELQIGDYGTIKKIDEIIEYNESWTKIIDIEPDNPYSIEGTVTGKGDVREFSREDGTPGIVANITVKDNTGDIKITLWGAHANIVHEIDVDTKIQIIDAYAKSGLNNNIELSVGERGKIKIV